MEKKMKESVKALLGAVVTIVVTVAGMVGYSLDASLVTNVLSLAVAGGAIAYGCWRNHNFSRAAQEAQVYIDLRKAGATPEDAAAALVAQASGTPGTDASPAAGE